MGSGYRQQARDLLKSAEEEIGSDDEQRLRYAALDLRMAMEALTYDRALAYKDEFPPSEYEKWQPRKVMSILLEIDPTADKDCSLAVGVEKEYGVPVPEMQSLGSEVVLSMKVLKQHYDALGSYLHLQSLKNTREGKSLNFTKFRNRCETIRDFISKVVSSPVFNITLGRFATIECMECKSPIRKRLPVGQESTEAKCHNCLASYTISDEGEGKVTWVPHQHEVECANPECNRTIVVWKNEMEIGRHWKCPACNGTNSFALWVRHENAPNK